MMSKTVRERLLEIAEAVENWETMQKDDVDVWLVTSTPRGAMTYIVSKVDAEDRETVRAALPNLDTEDFFVAAERIRHAAASLKEEKR
jgi:hypothetical protein